jgi:TetR/AcrR family transcriptional repressor of nem operon
MALVIRVVKTYLSVDRRSTVSETAERLMDLAEAHIRNAGYGRFSFRDLAAEIGIKSASVHHHFPTKATMAAAVARRYGDRFLAAVARRPNESAGDAISVYRLAFREALSRPGLTSGIGTEEMIDAK